MSSLGQFGNGYVTANAHRQKFRREVPIGPYTADFCCLELKLVIEIDGAPHLTERGPSTLSHAR